VPGPDGRLQAPHIAVNIFMRGLLKQLVTRIYFPGEAGQRAGRGARAGAAGAARHADREESRRAKAGALEWNVILQGRDETVFFDC
jgi:protocatechuate 3,4-dioxygenase alpha subunit